MPRPRSQAPEPVAAGRRYHGPVLARIGQRGIPPPIPTHARSTPLAACRTTRFAVLPAGRVSVARSPHWLSRPRLAGRCARRGVPDAGYGCHPCSGGGFFLGGYFFVAAVSFSWPPSRLRGWPAAVLAVISAGGRHTEVMSEDDVTGDVHVVSDAGEGTADLAVGTSVTWPPEYGGDFHVITLRGADGWQLDHPAQCQDPGDCRFTEAAGRISRAMCETLGRWTCDVSGGGLMLLERIGD